MCVCVCVYLSLIDHHVVRRDGHYFCESELGEMSLHTKLHDRGEGEREGGGGGGGGEGDEES